MLTNIIKMAKAAVIAAVVTDIVIDLVVMIYKKITAKAAEENWNDYLENQQTPLVYDPVSKTVN